MGTITQKVFTSRVLNVDADTYVGEAGRLFYAQTTGTGNAPVLKYSDGSTPGGLPLSGSSLTFSSSTPPVNPHDGLLWWSTLDGRLYIYYTNQWIDASPDVGSGVSEIIAGEGISINTSTGSVIITATGGGAGTGYAGSQGTTGYTGSQSYTGSQGTTGYTGSQSYTGSQGTTGYTGSQSYTGSQGYSGSQGTAGYTGSQSYTGSQGTTGYIGSKGLIGYTGSQGIPTDLTGYATQTWVNNKNYLTAGAGMTALNATANQTVVEDLGLGVWRVGTVQDIGTTSTVRFGDLTVNNLNVLSTITNVVPARVEGYRIYLASTATNTSQINGGGVQLGNTATGIHSIFYDINHQHWDFDGDGIKTQHLEATVSTVTDLTVIGGAHIGYANLSGNYPDTLLQLDAAVDGYAQVIFQNHSSSTQASADFVVTGDVGNDTTNYIDFGWANSRWDGSQPNSLGTALQANDGYLYAQGQTGTGNLVIGTTTPGSEVKLVVGGPGSENIVATFTTSSLNVDSINSLNSSTLSLNQGNGSVSVDSLLIPVGTIVGSNTATIYTLAGLTLTNVIAYSTLTTDALVTGEYGLLTGIPAPYAVYEFTQTPDPILQVGDILSGAGIPNILPSGVGGYTGTVVLAVCTGTYSNIVVGFSDYSVVPLPLADTAVLVGRNTVNSNLSIDTLPITDILLQPGAGGNVVVGRSILPLINDAFDLGSPAMRWRHVWVGAGTIYILDETLGTDTAIGARDGVVYLQGGTGLRVGEFTLQDNTIALADNTRNIIIGQTTATGAVIFNRPIEVNTTASVQSFSVNRSGRVSIRTPNIPLQDPGALNIVGSSDGSYQVVSGAGNMLHITGNDNLAGKITLDGFGTSYTGGSASITGRGARGTAAAPTNTQAGDILFRLSAIGYSMANYLTVNTGGSPHSIEFAAKENYTSGTIGSIINFYTSPVGQAQRTLSAQIDTTGLTLPSSNTTTSLGITFQDNTRQITAFTSTNAVTRVFAGTGTHVSTSTGDVTVWIDSYATTATVNTLIANSLTNYATQTYVTTRGYITSSSLSVATGSAVSGGALAYSTTTGVFTFNPATAYSLTTATSSALGGVKIGSGINAAGDGTISVTPFNTSTLVAHAVLADTATTATNAGYAYSFNTSTLVTTAVTANSVAGGYVSSITAGTGTAVSTSTGAVTIWAIPQAITTTGTTTASNYTIDLSGPTFIHWQPSANGNRTITLTGFTPGRRVEMFITPHATNDIFTVSGVTTSQCSNGKNTFTMNGVGASQQNSFILQIYCTTSDVGGVWIYGNGSL